VKTYRKCEKLKQQYLTKSTQSSGHLNITTRSFCYCVRWCISDITNSIRKEILNYVCVL